MTEIRMLNVYSLEKEKKKKKTIKISHTQFLTHTWPIWNVLAKIIKQKQQKNYSTLSFKLIICNGLSVRFQIFTLHAVFKLFCSTFVLIFVILVHFFFFWYLDALAKKVSHTYINKQQLWIFGYKSKWQIHFNKICLNSPISWL